LRAGTSVVQEHIELRQRDRPCLVVIATYGRGRSSSLEFQGPVCPDIGGTEGHEDLPYVPGVIPSFTRHLDYRFAIGTLPFRGAPRPELGGWFRLRTPGEVPAEELVPLLADAWPCPTLPALTEPTPSSTVTWWLSLTPAAAAARPDAWFLFHGLADHAEDGYSPAQGTLWDAEGRLLARSSQLDVLFG
jgi:acyl-CoA thioesterase